MSKDGNREHFSQDSRSESVTVESHRRFDILREGKYWAPASDDSTLLPTTYQNVNSHPLHPDFLWDVFPERFSGMSLFELFAMISRNTLRKYFAGGIHSFEGGDGSTVYGFDSVADFLGPEELLTQQETFTHGTLRSR
jgi:hypothetical protein